jgi:hypothetical protein
METGISVDENGGVLAGRSPLSYHIRYPQMKTAILSHIINIRKEKALHTQLHSASPIGW